MRGQESVGTNLLLPTFSCPISFSHFFFTTTKWFLFFTVLELKVFFSLLYPLLTVLPLAHLFPFSHFFTHYSTILISLFSLLTLCYLFPSDTNPIIYSFFFALFPWRTYTCLWPQLLAPWKWSLITPPTLICALIIRYNFVMFNDC